MYIAKYVMYRDKVWPQNVYNYLSFLIFSGSVQLCPRIVVTASFNGLPSARNNEKPGNVIAFLGTETKFIKTN